MKRIIIQIHGQPGNGKTVFKDIIEDALHSKLPDFVQIKSLEICDETTPTQIIVNWEHKPA